MNLNNVDGPMDMRDPPRGISSIAISSQEVERKKWSKVELMAFTGNFIVGTGFLTLPAAIAQSGIALGSCVLVLTGLLSAVATDCILEATARVVPMQRAEHHEAASKRGLESGRGGRDYGATAEGGGCEEPLTIGGTHADTPNGSLGRPAAAAGGGDGDGWVVPEERVEMPQLCERWLGEPGRRAYVGSVILYCYASLWAYAVLVGQTLSVALPMSEDPENAEYSYWFYLLCFGLAAVFMATRNITGPFMTALNLGFSYGRVLTCFLMVATLTHAVLRADPHGLLQGADPTPLGRAMAATAAGESDDTFVPSAPAPMFRLAGAVQVFTVSIFSVVFQHSIPTLAEPAADKRSLHTSFGHTVALVVGAYLLISLPAVAYFGMDCLAAVNLNWAAYQPTYWAPLASLVRNFIVFFPALSLVSTYPLLCITLANNMSSVLSTRVNLPAIAWRLLAAVPPIFLAALVSDLTAVSAVAGVFGLALILVFPVLLQLFSRRIVEARCGKGAAFTAYGSVVTRSEWGMNVFAFVGLAVTAACAVATCYQLLLAPLFTLAVHDLNPNSWGR